MSDVAIRVGGLGKQYHIGGPQKTYDALTDQVSDIFMSPLRRAGKLLRGQATGATELDEQFWALKDVSFEVKQGEVVGIIGRNGAGKSTLLKILSEITEPTEGYADIYGRVGSLLEVGTGFHPELTGRENIFLNGAILGMRKEEIRQKFDEIVAFAEIDKFLDTPVKHYSSGMYVRLAFAVAAHLEPEILLVDEVLAVGDMAFQKKCLGKMNDVAEQGRTVLFISHNMGIIQALCQRGIFLQEGAVRVDGTITEAVNGYLRIVEKAGIQNLAHRTDRTGKGNTKLIGVETSNSTNPHSPLRTGDAARFIFYISNILPGMFCVFGIYDQLGRCAAIFKSDIHGSEDSRDLDIGSRFICEIDELLVTSGRYIIHVSIQGDGERQDYIEAAAQFDIEAGQVRGRPVSPDPNTNVYAPHRWIVPTKN